MKKLIILILLGIAGYYGYKYYGYQYFLDFNSSETNHDYWQSLPEQCQDKGKSLQDSVERHDIDAKTVGYRKALRACLRKTDLSESEIDDVCDKIMGIR